MTGWFDKMADSWERIAAERAREGLAADACHRVVTAYREFGAVQRRLDTAAQQLSIAITAACDEVDRA